MSQQKLGPRERALADTLLERASQWYDVSVDAITSGRRTRSVTDARWSVICALRDRGWSWERIAGGVHCDHTTAINAFYRFREVSQHEQYLRDGLRYVTSGIMLPPPDALDGHALAAIGRQLAELGEALQQIGSTTRNGGQRAS